MYPSGWHERRGGFRKCSSHDASRRSIAVALCLLDSANTNAAAASRCRVLAATGHFAVANSTHELEAGDFVLSGVEIASHWSPKGSYVDILLSDGRLLSRDCGGAFACWRSVRIPETSAEDSIAERVIAADERVFHHAEHPVKHPGTATFWSALESIFLPEEDIEYETGNVRGVTRPGEAVLDFAGEGADLSPLVSDLPEGSYSLRFVRAAELGQQVKPIEIEITVPPPAGAPATFPEIKPGLYDVSIDGPEQAGAFVLVVKDDVFEKSQALFSKAVEIASRWKGAHSDSVNNFLRAYLADLAASHVSD